ncbi:MAG: hypothetical protein KJ052_17830 [Candidatus Hydrogenedentes bacterium]|nr:hypothetical protein [Candidatus Hydrogenedentota bacterium]
MRLIPRATFDIETHLTREEVLARLKEKIAPREFLRIFRKGAEFEGEVTDDGFRIARIVYFRTWYHPVTSAKIMPGEGGAKVCVDLLPKGLDVRYRVFVLCFLGMLFFLLSEQNLWVKLALYIAVVLLSEWFSVRFFRAEVRKQERLLTQMFNDAETAQRTATDKEELW